MPLIVVGMKVALFGEDLLRVLDIDFIYASSSGTGVLTGRIGG